MIYDDVWYTTREKPWKTCKKTKERVDDKLFEHPGSLFKWILSAWKVSFAGCMA